MLLYVWGQVAIGGLAGAQMDDSLTGCEMRQQGSGKNDDKRQMQGDNGRTPYTTLDEIEDSNSRQQCPKGRKPPGSVDVVGSIVRAMVLFNDSGGRHDDHHYQIECYNCLFQHGLRWIR